MSYSTRADLATVELSIPQMLGHGLHLGHLSRFWNPKMKPYIYKIRYGVHIINLVKTEQCFNRALSFIEKIVAKGGKVLFVGTKARASDLIAQHATRAGMPYVNHRWLGGMLTNFKTVKQSISRLMKLQEMAEQGYFEKLTKKEALIKTREMDKLEKTLGGIKKLGRLPDALFVVDVGYEDTAIKEANKLGIPVIGIVDTNNSPDGIQYIIPANDDAILSIDYSLSLVSNLIESVKSSQSEQQKVEAKQLAREPQAAKRAPKQEKSAKPAAEKEVAVAAPVAAAPVQDADAVTISAADVKKLRELTEAPMMDCKKALVQAQGDFEKAKAFLMESSERKAAKSATRVAAEGMIKLVERPDFMAMVEVNCETDFVARDHNFQALGASIEAALQSPVASVEELMDRTVDGVALKEIIAQSIAKLGEKIAIRRIHIELKNQGCLAVYNHGGKIAAFARIDLDQPTLARDIAMQVAAMNPEYREMSLVPSDVSAAQEEEIRKQMAEEGEKSEKIQKSIIAGRLEKHFAERCLMSQEFIKQPGTTIATVLANAGAQLVSYGRFEVGEGIEKQVVDFAQEVMNQAKRA